jgi:hypothetical protein
LNKPKKSKLVAVFWLVLLLVCAVGAQTGAPQTEAKPATPQGQVQAGNTGPQKLSQQEAEELFKSADEILQFVSKDTGLSIKHKVECKLASRDEVVKYVEEKLAEDEDAQRLERSAVSLKKFGLLPRDFELRPYLLGLLKEQVAGFYDSKTKKLFLLDWVEPEAQKPVLAHELTHALQDQNFDIVKWGEGKGKPKTDEEIIAQDEESSAKQAVIEGQAMITLLDYSLAPVGASVVDSPAIVEAMKAGMVAGGGSPLYDKAPLFLRQALIFPYQYGMDFVREVLVKKGKGAAFAGTMRNPPATTREIMMPNTYLAGERITQMRPPDIDKILGKEYARYDFGGIGQFDVGVMMDLWSDELQASNAAPAWRGGYYWTGRKQGAKDGPVSMVFVTRWASAKDASEFAKTYAKGMEKRYATHETVRALVDGQGEWKTDEGPVRVSVKNDTVVAVEGFAGDVSEKIEGAVFGAKP